MCAKSQFSEKSSSGPKAGACPGKRSAVYEEALGDYRLPLEETPVTLQLAILGSDGVVIATDRQGMQPAKDSGGVDTVESEDAKVLFSSDGSIAALCSGTLYRSHFYCEIIEAARSDWDDPPALQNHLDSWWNEQRTDPTAGTSESNLVLVNAESKTAFTIRFQRDRCILRPKEEWDLQNGLRNGHIANASYFFLKRYLPADEPIPVNSLLRLVAHYILMGHKINPHGIGGLAIFVSVDGNPFQKIPNETIKSLSAESSDLDKQIAEALLKPLSVSASELPSFLVCPKRGT